MNQPTHSATPVKQRTHNHKPEYTYHVEVMMKFVKKCLMAISLAGFLVSPAAAESLGAPEGEVILTVTGKIGVTNQNDAAVFDFAMLEAMEAVKVETTTPWTKGVQSFTGVPLAAFLQSLEVSDGVLVAKAINDYAVEFPVSEALIKGPIIAYSLNGMPMSIRDKGPLWIVYPYDSDPKWQTEVTYSRSIWQLASIEIKSE